MKKVNYCNKGIFLMKGKLIKQEDYNKKKGIIIQKYIYIIKREIRIQKKIFPKNDKSQIIQK